MKRILLASASIFAFSGAAYAEVTFGGSATLGYNDTVNAFDDNNDGFYWDGNLAVTFSQALDNGLTAGVTFDFDIADDTNGLDLESGGYLLSLTSDMGSLFYGDTSFAAETYWDSAGDMESDGFSEADGETVLRGEVMYSGITAGVSMVVADADGNIYGDQAGSDGAIDQISVGATGSFGAFSFTAAYQEESDAFGGAVGAYDPATANGDFTLNEVLGVSASASFAGADVTLAYAQISDVGGDDESSIGIEASYPIGPVTLTGYFVNEDDADGDPNYGITVAYASGPIAVALDFDDDQGTLKTGIDASYDVGNGISVLAGAFFQDNEDGSDYETEYYVAGEVDLGGGASLLASFAVGEDNADDEIGAPDYQEGATIELSFEF